MERAYEDPPHDKMRYNGHEVIGLGVSMEKGGNIIQLGKGLEETVERIRAQLPVGIELERVSNQPAAVIWWSAMKSLTLGLAMPGQPSTEAKSRSIKSGILVAKSLMYASQSPS